MNPLKWSKLSLSLTVAGSVGGILFSQGMSFARWNKFQSVDQNFNFHALLLALAGVGMCALAVSIGYVAIRLKVLEEQMVSRGKEERPNQLLQPTAPSGRG